MQSTNFRHDIHTLRAIAVLSVLFYHAGLVIGNFKFFSGGFLGVDIFFVISGFLITRILVEDFNENRFSFLNFYERRIRRIFPSLFLLLLVVSVASIYLMNDKQYYENSNAVLSALFFGSNFFFLFQDSYTSVASQFKPLIHTWSLGIEEQFYLFFPFLIFLLLKFNQNVKIYISLLIFLSLTSCFILMQFYPEENFYLSTSRFWELLTGGLVFFFKDKIIIKKIHNKYISILLWILLIAFLFYFNNKDNHPGLPNLVIVLLTSLIILIKNDNFIIFKNFIFKFFGDISYTLYLFHLPLFSFSRIKIENLSNFTEIILIIISVGISGIIYFFYEKKLKNFKFNNLLAILISIGVLLICFSIFNTYKNYKSKNIKINGVNYLINEHKELRWKYIVDNCTKLGWENCYKPQPGKKNFLVVGDSMAPDSGNIIKEIFESNSEFHIITDTLGGCHPHPNIRKIAPDNHPNLAECSKRNIKRFSNKFYNNIDAVIIHNNYSWFKPKDIIPYIDFLQSIGKNKIVLVGSYIHLNKEFVEILRQKKIKSTVNLNTEIFNGNIISFLNFDEEFEIISNKKGLYYISFKKLCPNGNCIFFTDKGYPFTWDMFHLSKRFIEYFVKNYFEEEKLKLYLSN